MHHPPKRYLAALLTLMLAFAMPASVFAEGELPSKFDLRDRGVVTPVKLQEPWGDCWSHSAIAAAETSILSKMGSTYADTGLDLSERHLAWYVTQPVTENISTSQAGEGLHVYNTEASANHVFDFGGREQCAATLFAQGIGPMPEQDYPNKGAEGRLALDDLRANKEAYIASRVVFYRDMYWYASDNQLRTMAEADYRSVIARYERYDAYSPLDDWSINEPDEPGSGKLKGTSYTLTDNNIFTYWARLEGDGTVDSAERYDRSPVYTDGSYNLYQENIDQIKAEVHEGRGVSVGLTISSERFNYETWAAYDRTHAAGASHVACIVGWDDNYAASNFTHTTNASGKVLWDDANEAREETTPPANGAWIVKNSWGSQTDLVPNGLTAADGTTKDAHGGDWGIKDSEGKHTGYFYLSYYDGTITVPESYDFEIKANNDQQDALQLDYLPASVAEWSHMDDKLMWEANVFTLEKDMRIDEVATRIRMSDKVPLEGFTCKFELYKLHDGATNPDDGELLTTCTREFERQGYHRTALDAPVYLRAGDRLGIVVQQSHIFDDNTTMYCASAQEADGYRERHSDPVYGTPVLNEGESFWKMVGITDKEEASQDGWLDMTAPLTEEILVYLKPDITANPSILDFYLRSYEGKPLKDFFNIDNFCIKAFGEPIDETSIFVDVDSSTAHANDIYWLATSGISEGWKLADGTAEFRPYANVARADMAAFLCRLASKWGLIKEGWEPQDVSPFKDVNEKTPHYREIMWLAQSGISEGWTLSDGSKEFRPYANIARADMAAFLNRLALKRDGLVSTSDDSAFTDVSAATAHAEDILWLAQNGISEGWKHADGTAEFRPYANVARADMAAFLHRMDALQRPSITLGEDELELGQNDSLV